MRTKDFVELLGGAGLGAGLMYLLDPVCGAERRDYLSAKARPTVERGRAMLGQAASTAGDIGGSVGQSLLKTAKTVSKSAGRLFGRTVDTVSDVGENVVDTGGGLLRSASGGLSHLGSNIAQGATSAWESVRGLFGGRTRRYSGFMPRTATGQAIGTAGIVTAACACVFFSDPVSGRRRRAMVRDKFASIIHTAGDAIDRTSRHAWNLLRGLSAEISGLFGHEEVRDHQLMERVEAPSSMSSGVSGMMHSVRGNWGPTTRVASSVVGGALAVYGVQRNDWIGYTLGALGLGLVIRGATNVSVRRVARRVTSGSAVSQQSGSLLEEQAANPT